MTSFPEHEGHLAVNSPELFQHVGAVAVWGAEVEGMVAVIFTHLLGAPPDRGAQLGRGQDFRWLHDRCVDLLRPVQDEWAQPMRDALHLAKNAMEDRNKVIHATFWPAKGGGVLAARPRRAAKSTEVFPVNAATLRSYHHALTGAWSYLLTAYYAAAGVEPAVDEADAG
jgi:hypothetical protein